MMMMVALVVAGVIAQSLDALEVLKRGRSERLELVVCVNVKVRANRLKRTKAALEARQAGVVVPASETSACKVGARANKRDWGGQGVCDGAKGVIGVGISL